ncbi:MAG TPA: BTAD domain-containing putative transcriptional regulator [Candidatus Tyrphobacter sp.]
MSTGVPGPARTPKKSAQILVRERLLTWLERHGETPLRALIAPAGFGKSTLLEQYASRHPNCRYAPIGRLHRVTDRLPMILCERLGLPLESGRSVEAALAALDGMPECEIAIDEVDALRPEELDALAMIVLQAPPHVGVILASRSRTTIGDPRRLLDGTTAVLDASQLAFTASEVAELCDLAGVDAGDTQVAQLLRESEGWPLVVAGAIRVAAEAERNLTDAMHRWSVQRGAAFREMVVADAAASDLGPALLRRCSAEGLVSNDELHALERAGLYVRRTESGYGLLRAVAAAFDVRGDGSDLSMLPDATPIFARLLGEFEVRIAGRRVEWVRRKDALLFKYLLLDPLGRASRADLCEVFWPTHDRQQAAQNLRTTCSNVRSALRRCLPDSRVDLYFQADGRDITLRNDLAVTDLARFLAHVAAAREAMAEQRLDRAVEAYEAARALYRGPLIVDPPTPAHEAVARDVDESFNEAQRHLTALRRLGADVVPLRPRIQANAATA